MPANASSPARPAHQHGQAPFTAVLLCNLGTPDEPTPAAVRRYLAEFLGDPRVVEIPRAAWLPLLYGVILPLRSAKSAAKYATIWTPEGSPLKVWTERQAKRLQGWLGEHGHRVRVAYGMRYGNPSITAELEALANAGADRILILTAYPQYSGTTTASVIDAVAQWAQTRRCVPELRFVNRYHDDRGYLQALAHVIQRHWRENGRPDHLVMSFHGVPERTLHLGDPYHCECRKTARLLAEALQLEEAQYTVSFQSRFGKAKWLEPYTEPTLQAL
ncbi:MAG TPA: ferrochelatase, partial [Ramlibacter sp.]